MVTQKVYYGSMVWIPKEDKVEEYLESRGISTDGRSNDWLVLAGGLSCYKDKLVEALGYLSKFYSQVFFVFGNVDFRLNGEDYNNYINSVCKELEGYENVHILHNKIVEVGGFRVAGSSAWYYLADNYAKAQWGTLSFDFSSVHPLGYRDSNAHSIKDNEFLKALKGEDLDLLITYFPPCEGDIECANLEGVSLPEDLPWIAGKDNFYNEDMSRVRSYYVFDNTMSSWFYGLPYLELKKKERKS
jgi:hypothetical protein